MLMAALLLLLYLIGYQEMLYQGLVGPVATVFGYLGMAFSMTIAVDLIFMGIIWFFEWLFSRLRGAHVQYG